jgi:hypothetical protein
VAHRAAKRSAPEVLERLLARHEGRQVFVFGPTGAPFLAARLPVRPEEIPALDRALALIEQLEAHRPKPFFEYDAEHRLLVAALGSRGDLYFVVLDETLGPLAAEARVAVFRDELAPLAPTLRDMLLASGGRSSA